MAAYRITARSLERQQVSGQILKEFASLDDASHITEPVRPSASAKAKVVFVLEEDDSPMAGAPQRLE